MDLGILDKFLDLLSTYNIGIVPNDFKTLGEGALTDSEIILGTNSSLLFQAFKDISPSKLRLIILTHEIGHLIIHKRVANMSIAEKVYLEDILKAELEAWKIASEIWDTDHDFLLVSQTSLNTYYFHLAPTPKVN